MASQTPTHQHYAGFHTWGDFPSNLSFPPQNPTNLCFDTACATHKLNLISLLPEYTDLVCCDVNKGNKSCLIMNIPFSIWGLCLPAVCIPPPPKKKLIKFCMTPWYGTSLKGGTQYGTHPSVMSGWCWNRLYFYSSIASSMLASIQAIRLSENLTPRIEFLLVFLWGLRCQRQPVNQC